MTETYDLIITGAEIIAPIQQPGESKPSLRRERADIGVRDGRIAAIDSSGLDRATAKNRMKADGLLALPGAIDTQVHFRDPGFPEKETLESGSRAALMGGVTSFFDMPNTKPATLSAIDVADKMTRAAGKCWVNYAFYVGGSPDNAAHLAELERLPGVCGIKIFMGSSTGRLIIGSDETLDLAVRTVQRRFAVHAEDETRLQERKKIVDEKPGHVELHPVWRDEETALIATKKIVALAEKYRKRAHVLHVTTAEEAQFLSQHKEFVSFEVTPQHLTLAAPECYERLGTLAQMNPPIRTERHREGLWLAVKNGWADVIGSDHAPHTLSEKKGTYPQTPSGMTGVQTLLPLMLHHCSHHRLSIERLVEMTAQRPAEIFGIQNKGALKVGYDADIALVDLQAKKTITNSWIESRCGWTPYDGMTVHGWVAATIVNGHIAMRDGQILGGPAGRAIQF
jgi:dihydroorotase